MAEVWSFDPKAWPGKFGRKWLWTIFAERVHHVQVVALCVEIGITALVILCNDSPASQPEFSIKFGNKTVVELSELARKAGVTVHLGTWLDPTEEYVTACAAGMAELATQAKAASVCLDLEGEWNRRISNHAAFVAGTVAPAFMGFPVPIGVTSFAILPRQVVAALSWVVQYHNGYGQPQAYSVFQDKSWQNNTTLQPDHMSSLAWKSWSPITRRLICIQAAYGKQAGPGVIASPKNTTTIPGRKIVKGEWVGKPWGVTESLVVAAQRAEMDGYPEIGWWSQEALSKPTAAATERKPAIRQIKTTGKSMLGKAWGKALAVGAATLAFGGGLLLALRRGRK